MMGCWYSVTVLYTLSYACAQPYRPCTHRSVPRHTSSHAFMGCFMYSCPRGITHTTWHSSVCAEHRYTRASLSFANLKGRDRQVAQALAACHLLETHAALLTRFVQGVEDEEKYGQDSSDMYMYGDENEDEDLDEDEDEGGSGSGSGSEGDGPGGLAGVPVGGPAGVPLHPPQQEEPEPTNVIEEMIEVGRGGSRVQAACCCTVVCQ
jgi:hypothetical protein